MNLRCIYCQTPFTLSRNEMLAAIISMNEKTMNHYDAHCPRCRRANSISRQRMELFFPNWQEAAKHQPPRPVEAASSAPLKASTMLKTEPISKAAKKAAAKPRTRAGKGAAKPVAKKPAAKKASTPKPSAKKTPANKKKK